MALGVCPKAKLFRGYIDLEIQMREFDRCRKLYEKFLLFDAENCAAWIKFAELETLLGETERARAVFDTAVAQPRLDMPELLWKAYIDFETEQEEWDRARDLYRNLLAKTSHVKVWMSFARFELGVDHDEEPSADAIAQSRSVYDEANKALAGINSDAPETKEHRLMLLEAWKAFEEQHGDDASIENVEKRLPRRVKKRRKIEDEAEGGWEEYFDYIFPEDESARPNLKLLAMAKMWKKQKEDQRDEEEAPQEEKTEEENEPQDENPDADDEDIRNESSSSDDDDDE